MTRELQNAVQSIAMQKVHVTTFTLGLSCNARRVTCDV
jgi:hypothetical protein